MVWLIDSNSKAICPRLPPKLSISTWAALLVIGAAGGGTVRFQRNGVQRLAVGGDLIRDCVTALGALRVLGLFAVDRLGPRAYFFRDGLDAGIQPHLFTGHLGKLAGQ